MTIGFQKLPLGAASEPLPRGERGVSKCQVKGGQSSLRFWGTALAVEPKTKDDVAYLFTWTCARGNSLKPINYVFTFPKVNARLRSNPDGVALCIRGWVSVLGIQIGC